MSIHQLLDTLFNGPARYTQRQNMGPGKTLLVVIGALLLELGVAYLIVLVAIKSIQQARPFVARVLRCCGVGKQQTGYVFLQLTFPANTTKSAFATEQLHILLRSMVSYASFWERLAGTKQLYSLVLVATNNEGIRYIIMVPDDEAEVVRRTLLSYLPGLKVMQVDDYLADPSDIAIGVTELALGNDFVLPLKDHKALEEHDPIAYITGHMRSLAPQELIAFQIVVAPVFKETHHNVLRRVQKIQHCIALNKQLSPEFTAQRDIVKFVWLVAIAPLWVFFIGLKLVAGTIDSVFSGEMSELFKSDSNKRSSGNPYEQELGKTIKTKLDQHLFEVSMRILVATPDANSIGSRLSAIDSSFQPFSSPYQSIGTQRSVPVFSPTKHKFPRFHARALSPHIISQSTIVSSSELADLYHFPNTDLTKTEGLVKSRSRDLPAPLSQKHTDAELDVIVGANEFGGHIQEIGMTLKQRQKHTYIIGKTGTGKTTLLMGSIYQDMLNGKGLAVFDPHGDMFRELLSIVPEHRRKDVVVFDPSDREYPIGLNILDPGIEFADEDDKHEWITSTVLSVFAKLADGNQWGPRMEHILRNTTLTALQTPKPSLYTLQRLLTDKKYQRDVAKTLKDPVLKQFWEKEFKMLGSMQMSSATAPLTHRLGHFITAKMSRHILLQEKSTVRIADIMNEGKILLVNLSKGDIGEDQSFFFGTILTSFIWMRLSAHQDSRKETPRFLCVCR